jgi:CRP/FNR family transcriptional regulator
MQNAPGGEILLQTAAFSALGRRRCANLAVQAEERTYARGEVIFSENSCSEGLFLLVQGGLRITVRAASGGSVVVREQRAPAAIFTAGLLDGGSNCAAAIATSDCATYVLKRDRFLRFCRHNPDVAICLLTEIGSHLRRTSAFMDLITATGVHQRLARVLLDLMEDAGSAQFALPCSQTELAARLGTVRELIYRNLRLLRSKGVLQFSGKHIVVTDAPALVSAAGASMGGAHVFEPHGAPPHPACFILERTKGPLNDSHSRDRG